MLTPAQEYLLRMGYVSRSARRYSGASAARIITCVRDGSKKEQDDRGINLQVINVDKGISTVSG
jgi:hypothetical protein